MGFLALVAADITFVFMLISQLRWLALFGLIFVNMLVIYVIAAVKEHGDL
jgi:hypothetical protein